MPSCRIQFILPIVQKRIASCLSLATDADTLFQQRQGGRYRPIGHNQKLIIAELAFLHVFLAWEDFLEQSFVRYMCGAVTASGYAPRRYVAPPTLSHAHEMVALPGRRYADWTDIEDVIALARLYFADGEPYEPALRPLLADFKHMSIIRNGIAHRSEHSKKKLQDVTRGLIGYVPPALTPGILLRTTVPTESRTFGEKYCSVVLIAAQRIIR